MQQVYRSLWSVISGYEQEQQGNEGIKIKSYHMIQSVVRILELGG